MPKLTLNLGVLVQPYAQMGGGKNRTTGDVATFIEKRYGVMGVFARRHEQDIADALELSLAGALEALLMGGRVEPYARAGQMIEQEFRRFISSREVERVGIRGVPTKAALRGYSSRYKSPGAKRGRRPSFRNTGLYMNSMRAWTTER